MKLEPQCGAAMWLERTIQIQQDKDNGTFSFPNLDKTQILAIRRKIEESPEGEIEIFAGDQKDKLRINHNEQKFELIFP